jgi:hypothetical protein
MPETNIVKHDQGGVNARILARENKADFRRVEAASIKLKASFASAEGKRMFVRYFSTLQLSAHFISVIARTRLDHTQVAQVETVMRDQMDKAAEALNKAIDGAEALFEAHGITSPATYDTVPLEIEVGILSSYGRRYLELLGKLDQLMPLLQTLEIHEVVTTQAVDIERAGLKRKVRDVANGARSLATRMRRAMNALDAQKQGVAVDREVADGGREEETITAGRPPVQGEGSAAEDALETAEAFGATDSPEAARDSAEDEASFQRQEDHADGIATAVKVG